MDPITLALLAMMLGPLVGEGAKRGMNAAFGNPELDLLRAQAGLEKEDRASQTAAMRQYSGQEMMMDLLSKKLGMETAISQGNQAAIADAGAGVQQHIGNVMSNPVASPLSGSRSPLVMRDLLGIDF